MPCIYIKTKKLTTTSHNPKLLISQASKISSTVVSLPADFLYQLQNTYASTYNYTYYCSECYKTTECYSCFKNKTHIQSERR